MKSVNHKFGLMSTTGSAKEMVQSRIQQKSRNLSSRRDIMNAKNCTDYHCDQEPVEPRTPLNSEENKPKSSIPNGVNGCLPIDGTINGFHLSEPKLSKPMPLTMPRTFENPHYGRLVGTYAGMTPLSTRCMPPIAM